MGTAELSRSELTIPKTLHETYIWVVSRVHVYINMPYLERLESWDKCVTCAKCQSSGLHGSKPLTGSFSLPASRSANCAERPGMPGTAGPSILQQMCHQKKTPKTGCGKCQVLLTLRRFPRLWVAPGARNKPTLGRPSSAT